MYTSSLVKVNYKQKYIQVRVLDHLGTVLLVTGTRNQNASVFKYRVRV